MLSSLSRRSGRLAQCCAGYSTIAKPKTAIVMLNMGGPKTTDQVPDYLLRIMTDRDMIQLPVQSRLGPWIASRRSEEVKKKYQEIGGGSPILKWTETQGALLAKELDQLQPSNAPHKPYVAFRYVPPFTEDAFNELERDGVERAVIFSQYPQYSCATTGSSLNAIADFYRQRDVPSNVKFSLIERWASHPLLAKVFAERINEKLQKFDPKDRDDVLILFTAHSLPLKFSLIERWASHPLLAKVFAERINEKLQKFDPKDRDDVLILFTAHSLPLKAVSRGDTYPHEVAATVANTMTQLRVPNPHRLVWQSKVGPLPWLQPYTDDAIKGYAKKGHKHMVLVPIAFVNEHIETLHELDIEYCEEVATEAGVVQIERAAAPNDHPTFIKALADIVTTHMKSGPYVSTQFLTRCPHCVSDRCRTSKEFFKKLCGRDVEKSTIIGLNV